MRGLFLLLLLYILRWSICQRQPYDITNTLRPHENEFFELYYLQSYPREEDSYGVFIQSSGIAIRSTRSLKVIVLEYIPVNSSVCMLPITKHTSYVPELVWDKTAMIALSKNIDTSFWLKSVFLARVNSVVYRHYLDWVRQYIEAHPFFIPQTVCLTNSECLYLTQNWDTFIADSFMQLSEFAVSINPLTPLFREELVFSLSQEPKEVIYSDDLLPYYTSLLKCIQAHSSVTFGIAMSRCANSSSVTYLHIQGRSYLQLVSSSSYSSVVPLAMPPPHDQPLEKRGMNDYIIVGAIGALIAVGALIALYKVRVIRTGCCGRREQVENVNFSDNSEDEEEGHHDGENVDLDYTSHGFAMPANNGMNGSTMLHRAIMMADKGNSQYSQLRIDDEEEDDIL